MRNYTTKYGNLTKLADNNMEKVKEDIQIHSRLGAAYIKNKTKLSNISSCYTTNTWHPVKDS